MTADRPEITTHPGYVGVFTRAQHPGAFANGSRVRKVAGEPGDAHPVGTLATVLGSIDLGVGYFVEWDGRPGVAVFVAAWKVNAANR